MIGFERFRSGWSISDRAAYELSQSGPPAASDTWGKTCDCRRPKKRRDHPALFKTIVERPGLFDGVEDLINRSISG